MDFFGQKKVLDLAYDLFVRGKSNVTRIPYTPAKKAVLPPTDDYFPRMTPESRGIDSRRVTSFLAALEENLQVNLHALTILADGAVIGETAAPGYDRRIPHISHSMCKSVVGLAVGMLWDEGKIDLDTPAYTYFTSNRLPGRIPSKNKAITPWHLLTMSSGVSFAETGSVVETDWVKAFFTSDVKFEPGSDFAYNSMNTYILSVLIREITGEGLCDYLRPRLFEPLHIQNYYWETCPMGQEKGGWGLYIAEEDMAKIGQTCLCGGMFEGKRIISETWLREACHAQKVTPANTGDYNYAYQMWVARDGSAFLFNGMLGQNVWVHPANRMVIISHAGNNEFFQQSAMLALFADYFGGNFVRNRTPLKKNKKAVRELRDKENTFFSSRQWVNFVPTPGPFTRFIRRLCRRPVYPLPAGCARMDEKSVFFPESNQGILPLFVRLMQNNHTAGLRRVSFTAEGEKMFVTFHEGEGEIYRLEVGFYGYAHTVLRIKGEVYRVAVGGQFAVDEDGHRVLKLDILFPEFSHARRIKFGTEDGHPIMVMRESPGKEVVEGLLDSMPAAAPRAIGILQFLSRHFSFDFIYEKIYEKFEPTLIGEEHESGKNQRNADFRTT